MHSEADSQSNPVASELSSVSEVRRLKCNACGAPIDYLAGENVVTCSYCGTSQILDPAGSIVRVKEHFLIQNRKDETAIRSIVNETLGRGKWKPSNLQAKAEIISVERKYLPFWIVNCHAYTSWSGMNQRERTRQEGGQQVVEKYWEPDSGNFDEERSWVVFARKDKADFWGLDAFNVTGKSVDAQWDSNIAENIGDRQSEGYNPPEDRIPFSLDKIEDRTKVVNGQIDKVEAEGQAKNEIIRFHREMASRKVDRLTDCQTTVDLNRTMLLHVPLWFITYRYRNKEYRMLIEGHEGRVIKETHPVGDYDKAFVYSMYTLIPAAIVLFIHLILIFAMDIHLWFLWLIIPVAIIIITIIWVKAILEARKWS